MCLGYLGFILFACFPGVLHAPSAAQPCRAPRLREDGYVVPDQTTYAHGTNLTYACNEGRKPAVDGWWVTVTCHNGKWSHTPQCINKKACLPPTIPNGEGTASQNGWYEDKYTIRIKCHTGYTLKDNDATANCINGTWSSLPVCERSDLACDEPPQIPHAFISQGYQEVFAVDSEVKYECEDGYVMEGGDSQKSVFCTSGFWSKRPKCRSIRACVEPTRIPHAVISPGNQELFDPDAEVTYECEDGYTVEGEESSISIFCINGTWTEHAKCRSLNACDKPPQIPNAVVSLGDLEVFDPESEMTYKCDDGYTVEGGGTQKSVICRNGSWTEPPTCIRETRPSAGHNGATAGSTDGGHRTSDGSGTQPGAGGSRPGTGHGGSAGGGHTTRPGGGGSSTSSSHSPFTAVSHCGKPPVVPDAEVVQTHAMFLKFQCASFYRLQGPEKVKCYNDGTWSELPICKATYCTVNTAEQPDLVHDGVKYIKDGDKVELDCEDKYWAENFAVVKCTDGRATISRCCNRFQITTRIC